MSLFLGSQPPERHGKFAMQSICISHVALFKRERKKDCALCRPAHGRPAFPVHLFGQVGLVRIHQSRVGNEYEGSIRDRASGGTGRAAERSQKGEDRASACTQVKDNKISSSQARQIYRGMGCALCSAYLHD